MIEKFIGKNEPEKTETEIINEEIDNIIRISEKIGVYKGRIQGMIISNAIWIVAFIGSLIWANL